MKTNADIPPMSPITDNEEFCGAVPADALWAVEQENLEIKKTLRELLALFETVEENDEGVLVHPNRITASRALDNLKINQCLKRLKEFSNAHKTPAQNSDS
jgi:hypothetical protein